MKFERGLFGLRYRQFLYAPFVPLLFAATLCIPIRPAHAVTCGFGADMGDGDCRGFISTTTSSFTVPNDWNSASNTVELIGAGGNGGAGAASVCGGGGGGGGLRENCKCIANDRK